MAKADRTEEARRWFLQAQHDLRAAQWNAEGGFFDTACFLAQQAGEKVLKSLHYFLGTSRRVLLTHSVVTLLRKAVAELPALAESLEGGRGLDLHYVPSRYPNGLPGGYPHRFYGKETAEKAIAASAGIFAAVEQFYRDRQVQWEEDE
jgi:HEPN domain-containing protein